VSTIGPVVNLVNIDQVEEAVGKYIVNLYEAKTNLSGLVERVSQGDEIVIAKAGVPKAKLVPIAGPNRRRQPGGWEGKVRIRKDFDEPLPEEVLRSFVGARNGRNNKD
jgi:prevent-host-death family protein